jgi:hypothetical protein
MAECRCGHPECEHCGGGEPSTVPDRGQAFDNEGPPIGLARPVAVPELRTSGHPVRDLADAIRAVALVHATGRPFAEILLDALALANKLDDGTHGCDTCKATVPR